MTLTFHNGTDAKIDVSTGTNNYSDEALVEIDLSSEGYPRYTIYEVSADAKRHMLDDTVPVIQFDTGGDNNFVAVTPDHIEYPTGRVWLSTARGATDVGRVHTGHYMTTAQLYGALMYNIKEEWVKDTRILLGNSCSTTFLQHKKWSVTVENVWMTTQATLTTVMGGGTENNIVLTHEPGGTIGNDVSLEIVDPAGNHTLSIEVTGKEIVVTAGYASGAITTTALQLLAALQTSDAVLGLGVTAALKTGDDGTGIITAHAHTHLSGGLDAEDYSQQSTKGIITCYKDYASDESQEGYCVIPDMDQTIEPGKVISQNMTFECVGPLYRRK